MGLRVTLLLDLNGHILVASFVTNSVMLYYDAELHDDTAFVLSCITNSVL